jgi:CO/xanthine dehydrogenase Mo-binding subunit
MAHDIGRALNAAVAMGQIEGSVYMGLGEAMMEEMAYRDRSHKGHRVFVHKIPSLLEYKSPSTMEMPEVVTYVVEDPDKNGPFGAKEVGQGPLLPIMPAVANAVFDAVGVRVDENPITFEKVFAAMQAKKEGKDARFGPSQGPDGVPQMDFGDSLKIKTPWQGGDGTAWNEPKRDKKAAK